MKLAVISDIHGDTQQLNLCGKLLSESDGILVCGDISRHGEKEEIERVIKELKEINDNVFAVPGNMDGKHSVEILENSKVNIHRKRKNFKSLTITGCGGSTKTPFGTPFELDEDEIVNCLASNIQDNEKTIVVCHNPPYKTKTDKTVFGLHVGSKKLRKLIEDKQPLAFLCGHIHESANVDKIGKTIILNPGPFRRGGIGILEITENEAKAEIVRV